MTFRREVSLAIKWDWYMRRVWWGPHFESDKGDGLHTRFSMRWGPLFVYAWSRRCLPRRGA